MGPNSALEPDDSLGNSVRSRPAVGTVLPTKLARVCDRAGRGVQSIDLAPPYLGGVGHLETFKDPGRFFGPGHRGRAGLRRNAKAYWAYRARPCVIGICGLLDSMDLAGLRQSR